MALLLDDDDDDETPVSNLVVVTGEVVILDIWADVLAQTSGITRTVREPAPSSLQNLGDVQDIGLVFEAVDMSATASFELASFEDA